MSDHFNRYGSDGHHEHNHHNNVYSHHGHGHYLMYYEYAKRILKNKTLLMVVLAFLLIILITGIWLISLLIPFLGQLLATVEKNGIKGAIETISPYLLKLWEGSGK
jgi:hypothetical protein